MTISALTAFPMSTTRIGWSALSALAAPRAARDETAFLMTPSLRSVFSAASPISCLIVRRGKMLARSSMKITVARSGSSLKSAGAFSGPAMKYAAGPRMLHPAPVRSVRKSSAKPASRAIEENAERIMRSPVISIVGPDFFFVLVERPRSAIDESDQEFRLHDLTGDIRRPHPRLVRELHHHLLFERVQVGRRGIALQHADGPQRDAVPEILVARVVYPEFLDFHVHEAFHAEFLGKFRAGPRQPARIVVEKRQRLHRRYAPRSAGFLVEMLEDLLGDRKSVV